MLELVRRQRVQERAPDTECLGHHPHLVIDRPQRWADLEHVFRAVIVATLFHRFGNKLIERQAQQPRLFGEQPRSDVHGVRHGPAVGSM